MSNPVIDQLSNTTPDTTWQNDATTTDTNHPQPSQTMGKLSATGLASELRAMKSIVKGFYKDQGWVNFEGDTAAPSTLPPTFITTKSFTLPNTNGNWTTAIVGRPAIAVVGRRVRFTDGAGGQTVATIILADPTHAVNTETLISVNDPVVPNPLAHVEFASEDPDQSQSWIDGFDSVLVGGQPSPVLPVRLGGTGMAVNPPFAGDVAVPNPLAPYTLQVAKINGTPVAANAIGSPTATDILAGTGAHIWQAIDINTMLGLGQLLNNNGYFRVPTTTGTGLLVQWAQGATPDLTPGSGFVDIPWPLTSGGGGGFQVACLAVFMFPSVDVGSGLPAEIFWGTSLFDTTGVRVNARVQSGKGPYAQPIPVYVLGIGF